MSQADLPKSDRVIPDGAEDPPKQGTGEPDGPWPTERALPRAGRLVAMAMSAGLLAGAGAWLIGEAALNAFRPPMQRVEMMGQVLFKARFEDQMSAEFKNAIVAFTALGGALGLALGVAGGLTRQSVLAGARSGFLGLVLGGLFGAGASLAFLPVYYRTLDKAQEQLSHDLNLPLMVHGGIWAACGLAGGLAFGIGLGGGAGRIRNAALGGLIGAAIGAAFYEIIGASIFPAAKTTNPISLTWETRLVARLLVSTLAGLFTAAVVNMPGRRRTVARPGL